MDWEQIITVIISTLSLIIALFSLKESVRKLNIEVITENRFEWLRDVRKLLTEFSIAYRLNCDDKNTLIRLKTSILMYFRSDDDHYNTMTIILDECCDSKSYNEKLYQKLIILSQRELARVWERVKAESIENMRINKKTNLKSENMLIIIQMVC